MILSFFICKWHNRTQWLYGNFQEGVKQNWDFLMPAPVWFREIAMILSPIAPSLPPPLSPKYFELWFWRRLLRVPWTARRSNQSILKEISPKYSLEELTGKHSDAGKDGGQGEEGRQRMRWLDGIIETRAMSLSRLRAMVTNRGGWCAGVHGVTESQHDSETEQQQQLISPSPHPLWKGAQGFRKGNRILGQMSKDDGPLCFLQPHSSPFLSSLF